MKKLFLTILISIITFTIAWAQKDSRLSVTIFGDSYSTFEGYLTPSHNEAWYFLDRQQVDNDVVAVEDTWWHQLIKKNGWRLCMNNSYSGSTISSSGYGGADYTPRSFVTRASNLGNPDIIFVFGATNDSWVPAPIGEYKYSGWTKDDLKSFRPSLAKMLDYMTKRYLGVKIYFILNSELSDAIDSSVKNICAHYNVPVIELQDVEKKAGHPSIAGMKAIAEQVDAFVKKDKNTGRNAKKAFQKRVALKKGVNKKDIKKKEVKSDKKNKREKKSERK